jgi:hypothetical protein
LPLKKNQTIVSFLSNNSQNIPSNISHNSTIIHDSSHNFELQKYEKNFSQKKKKYKIN